MNQISVCVVSQQYSEVLSGPGLYTRNLVHGLLAHGHDVTLIVPKGAGSGCPTAVNLIEIGNREFARRKGGWIILSLYFSRAVRKLIQSQKIDIVHFSDAKEAVFTIPLGRPVVGNVNDSYIAGKTVNPLKYRKEYPCDWFARWAYQNLVFHFERHATRRLNLNLCNSQFTGEQIVSRYGIAKEQVLTCFKSINLDAYDGMWKSFEERPVKQILFPGGGNAQRKGLINLLKAMDLVLANHPEVNLVVLGRDKVIPRLLHRYATARVKSRITVITELPNEKMKDFLAEMDCLVMPSLVEAFGVVYLEAMACGTPVVATRRGGACELVSTRENGLLVDPYNPEEIAEAIIEILTDKSLCSNLSMRGRETVKKFSSKRMLSDTIRAYSQVIQRYQS